MPSFDLVETALYSPTCCALCRCPDGPFVAVSVQDMTVATPGGPFDLEGHVYVCVGLPPKGDDDGRPGCAMQIGRAAGCADPVVIRDFERRLDDLAGRVVELTDELDRANRNRVVPLAEVQDALARVVL